MTKANTSIQVSVLGGLALFMLVFGTVVATMIVALETSHANHRLLSQVGRIEVVGQALRRRGLHYVEHAPRDYCPYDRDVIVFYPEFMADLDTYDGLIDEAVASADEVGMGGPLLGGSGESLRAALARLQTEWKRFRDELTEKLGDPKEPRLEWVAEYIRDHQDELDSLVGELTRTVEGAITERQQVVDRLAFSAIVLAALLFFMAALWFYLRVVRRVVRTVEGCSRVAQGEFGYQVPVSGRDELAVLAAAVNRLSSRARLVLELLDNMQRTDTIEHKLAFFRGDAGVYLSVNWLGLWQMQPEGFLGLVHSQCDEPLSDAKRRVLAKSAESDKTLAKIVREGEVMRIDDVPSHIISQPTARLLRELTKAGVSRSALAVPMVSDDGWCGLLVLSSKSEAAYDAEQAALLGNLSGVLANGLAQAIREAPDLGSDRAD